MYYFIRNYDFGMIHEYLLGIVMADVSTLLISRDSAMSLSPPSRFRVKYKLIPLQVNNPLPFFQGITRQYIL